MRPSIPVLATFAVLCAVSRGQVIVNQWPTGGSFAGGLEVGAGSVWIADETAKVISEYTLTGTPITSYPSPASLPIGVGYDPVTGMLWVGDENEMMYEMDPATGLATGTAFTTTPHITDLSGVATDPVTGNIYVSQDSGTPRRIVEFTQAGAMVMMIDLTPSGSMDPDGLAYVSSTDTFLLGEDTGDRIIEVDRAGAKLGEWATGGLGISPEGLGVDEPAGTVYVADGGGNTVWELSGIIKPVGGSTVYCTAKTNSLGCMPSIGGTGTPSASSGSGFTVATAMVRNQKPGLYFYKANGAQASVVFQCGTLCLGPSGIKRTPAQSAGGAPPPANDCSGLYSLDFNCFGAGACGGNPDPALQVAGTQVQAQVWGRDQGYAPPCNTTLSDALEWILGA